MSILTGDEPPREFRIFAAGWNETENGTYLFDVESAAAVMSAYQRHGVDKMLDLEHMSLAPDSLNYDPDARGWCRIELRGGELWAVDVRWTPDGERRLREKTQRYVSPAFEIDPDTKRITKIVNIAITALPATHATPALVAANALYPQEQGGGMTAEQLAQLAEILGMGSEAMVEDVLAAVAAVVKKVAEAAAGPAPEAAPAPEAMAEGEEPKPEEEEEKAVAASLVRLSGRKTALEALSEVEAWKASHLELAAEKAKLAAERQALETSERRKLVGELVKLGAEIPATAWADDKGTVPVVRLTSEPLEELRARVKALSGAPRAQAAIRAPVMGAGGLTERELEMCKTKKIDPAKYAETRAAIRARNARPSAQEA